MADSNVTRAARKAKQLTQNQFIREMSKYRIKVLASDKSRKKFNKLDKDSLFYLMMLCQATFDIKDLREQKNIKYPLAISFFAIFMLCKLTECPFNYLKYDKVQGANYHVSLTKIEQDVSRVLSYFNFMLFGIFDGTRKRNMRIHLRGILSGLVSMCKALDISIPSLLYLSCEFFKEINPKITLDGCTRLANKIVDIRELYLSRIEIKKITNIDRAIRLKFEELINED